MISYISYAKRKTFPKLLQLDKLDKKNHALDFFLTLFSCFLKNQEQLGNV